MATTLKLRRGTTTQHATFTGALGEVTVDTDKDVVVVHDGSTAGGFPALRAGAGASVSSLTNSGNITFTGTGNRITGDFSNATVANRVMFQTSTVNGNTNIHAITNGTGSVSSVQANNSSDLANGSQIYIAAGASVTQIAADKSGTGTYLPMTFFTGGSERMRVDTSGNVGIGTNSPATKVNILDTSTNVFSRITTADGFSAGYQMQSGGGVFQIATIPSTNGQGIAFTQSGIAERMRINSSGNVGIGTSSPASRLDVVSDAAAFSLTSRGRSVDEIGIIRFMNNAGSTEYARLDSRPGDFRIQTTANNPILFLTNGANERARIDASGGFLVGKTAADNTTAGWRAQADGFMVAVRASDTVALFNRKTNDGTLVDFQQDNTTEGSISVSGNTVSYNAFAGSHWSQLQDGSKPEILRGTVMESIDELVQWPDEPTTERLCRSKVSDTAGSKRVYGVFMCWDEDWTATNDMLVTSLGAFICRVSAGVTVQMGDLLESNGDGTARVQADDIIRSSTIGKVTGTAKTHEYDDGSYCVPTVLYCG
jgi:hypothetical protein